MIRQILFNAHAGRDEIVDEVAQIRHWPGMRTLCLLELAGEGEGAGGNALPAPRYCLQLETEDEHDAAIASRMQGLVAEYRDYLDAVSIRIYRAIG